MRQIPSLIKSIMSTIESHGKGAYLVGGCVRDFLMGTSPHDYDLTTSASPEEIMEFFSPHAIPTGLKHGTITVLSDDQRIEVTTFRSEGTYSDHRHPDNVFFTSSLKEDLKRRDFTVNAMAMDQNGKVYDYFHGKEDCQNGVLRCVGKAEERFEEDALRILRCLRFASKLGFSIEETTAKAIHEKKGLLLSIAVERIQEELDKLLVGKNVGTILRDYTDVFELVLPEIIPSVGFNQNNKHHIYDVWEHTIHAVEAIEPDRILRTSMLFHDLGKPSCRTIDAQGHYHFGGHAEASKEIAKKAMQRLHYSNHDIQEVTLLIQWHDCRFDGNQNSILHILHHLGELNTYRLLKIQFADNSAQHPHYYRTEILEKSKEIIDTLIANNICFSLKQLDIKGNDLVPLGIQDKNISVMLSRLLYEVMEGRLENRKGILLSYADKTKNSLQ